MADLILHHYPTSPFAEKIRAVLGAKQLAWHSVDIPRIMPKPDVIALTGGYRKTPVLQIGADIFCDTTLIAYELDAIAPKPALFPAEHALSAERLAQWSDTVFFQIAVALVFQPAVLSAANIGGSAVDTKAFIEDRMAMRKGATLRRVTLEEARASVRKLLGELNAQLGDGRSFLLGDAPTIADFAFYHCIWFIQRVPEVVQMLAPLAKVQRWYERVVAFGHGSPAELSSADAIAIARAAQPRELKLESDTPGFAPGDAVEVLPTDYGLDPSAGELVVSNEREIAIRRTDPRAGELIVHFPRWSYELRKSQS
jgi:glutathione S-transferase